MMKGADTGAMACRLPNGEIDVETWPENNGKNMPWYRRCPLVRGSFNFVLSMKDGYRCLMKSAEKQMPEDGEETQDEEEMNRFEKWLDEKLGDKVFGIIMTIGTVLGFVVALGLFAWLPKFAVNQLIVHTPIPDGSRFVRSLLEGILKIAIFLGYMACTGMMKDIRRTYEYHGAEHKTIATYESGDELTVAARIDVAMPVLHGMNGEDGTVQGLLELMNVPYTSAGLVGSSVGMDKIAMKQLFRGCGFPIIDYVWLTRDEWEQDAVSVVRRVEENLRSGRRYVQKSSRSVLPYRSPS